jgi:GrpB-like predicted nucleotidyltransferase (UPF0157 family)
MIRPMVPDSAVQGAPGVAAIDPGRPICVAPHDPEWSLRFESERAALAAAVGELAVGGIHHVGSTAIPGVDAEPVIDILIGTGDLSDACACIEPITQLGYLAHGSPDEEAHFFSKPGPERPSYELTLLPADAELYSEMLSFRDALRADRQLAIGYAGMKRDLACRNSADRHGYSIAKTELIRTILAFL